MRLLIWLIATVSALYEDQVDTFDWRKDSIGLPKFVKFDPSSRGASRHVSLVTESDVLAVLNAQGLVRHLKCFLKV